MIALEGGSFGLQLRGQATDFVLLVMHGRGAKAILSSKVQLGADASAAVGPKGRDAAATTDATMRAEILTYSRSRGLFAGVSLEGSTLRPDNDANRKLYKKEVHARDIVFNQRFVRLPPPTNYCPFSTADPQETDRNAADWAAGRLENVEGNAIRLLINNAATAQVRPNRT